MAIASSKSGTTRLLIILLLVCLPMSLLSGIGSRSSLTASKPSATAYRAMPSPSASEPVLRRTWTGRASRDRMAQSKASPSAARTPRIKAHQATVTGRSAFSALERHIRACESGDLISTYDYTMHGGPSTASGAWQVLDGTWDHYGGYARAYLAPPEVQDRWARAYFDKHGYGAWSASRSCWSG